MCAYHYDPWIVNQSPLGTDPGKHYGFLLQQRDLVVHLGTSQAGPHGESSSPRQSCWNAAPRGGICATTWARSETPGVGSLAGRGGYRLQRPIYHPQACLLKKAAWGSPQGGCPSGDEAQWDPSPGVSDLVAHMPPLGAVFQQDYCGLEDSP